MRNDSDLILFKKSLFVSNSLASERESRKIDMFSSFHHMSASYSDIILWAIFLFLSYIGYGAAVVRLFNLAEFNDFRYAARALALCKMRRSILPESRLTIDIAPKDVRRVMRFCC